MRKRTTWLDLLQQEVSRKNARRWSHFGTGWAPLVRKNATSTGWNVRIVYTLNWYYTLFSIRSSNCIWYISSNYRSISNCLLFCFMILLVYVRLKEGFFCCISWYFSSCYLVFFNYTHYFQFIAFVSVSFCQRDRPISHLPFYTVRLLGTF